MKDIFTPNEGYFDGSSGKRFHVILLRNALLPQAVTVGVAATKIPTIPLDKRRSILILNNSSNVIYIGHSGVTTDNGYPMNPQDTIKIDISDEVDVYGISTVASSVRILEGS